MSVQSGLSDYEDRFQKSRDDVLEAIRNLYHLNILNPHRIDKRVNYKEIRIWIAGHKHYHMENVGARCRELARDLIPPKILIEYDLKSVAWVTPIIFPKVEEVNP